MKIGYSKIGRSWKLDAHKGVTGSGDIDVVNALHRLARLRPEDTFYLLGRNSGDDPREAGFPDNVINPWIELGPILAAAKIKENDRYVAFMNEHLRPLFMSMDEHIVWAGQHGTSNSVIPKVEDRTQVTSPQDSMIRYGGFIIDGINHWRDLDPMRNEEIWLCPDVRNYIKCRDLKWPLHNSVIAQFDWANKTKHERYGDTTDPEQFEAEWVGEGVWHAHTKYTYSALELTALDKPDDDDFIFDARPLPFGMIGNENRAYVSNDRASALRDFVLSWNPTAEIFGKWSQASMEKLGRTDIRPCPSEHMRTVLKRWTSTFTTPASGSGWATAKPWEAFQNGTICFFHPKYDTQNHILSDAPSALVQWLRVKTPEELEKKVKYVHEDFAARRWIVEAQYELFRKKFNETLGGVAEVHRRLG